MVLQPVCPPDWFCAPRCADREVVGLPRGPRCRFRGSVQLNAKAKKEGVLVEGCCLKGSSDRVLSSRCRLDRGARPLPKASGVTPVTTTSSGLKDRGPGFGYSVPWLASASLTRPGTRRNQVRKRLFHGNTWTGSLSGTHTSLSGEKIKLIVSL